MLLSERLTLDVLANEFTLWRKDPGNLRFGQRIWNLYGQPGQKWAELFYEKNELEAYSLLMATIYAKSDLGRV